MSAISRAMTDWGDHVLRLAGVELRYDGPQPKPGATLFVANHQGYMDIPVLCSAIRSHQFSFVASDEFSRFLPLAAGVSLTRGIFIAKQSDRQSYEMMDHARELLSRDYSLLIFPEGRRSRGGEVGKFKPGSLRPAIQAKVPITPVSIEGTYKSLETSGRLAKRAAIRVQLHPSILPEDYASKGTVELAREIEECIRAAVREMKHGSIEHS